MAWFLTHIPKQWIQCPDVATASVAAVGVGHPISTGLFKTQPTASLPCRESERVCTSKVSMSRRVQQWLIISSGCSLTDWSQENILEDKLVGYSSLDIYYLIPKCLVILTSWLEVVLKKKKKKKEWEPFLFHTVRSYFQHLFSPPERQCNVNNWETLSTDCHIHPLRKSLPLGEPLRQPLVLPESPRASSMWPKDGAQ